MAITQSQYTAPDKVQGDIFYSDEHNEMKSVLNQKTDADNAILIEGNQSIDGDLSVDKIVSTSGADITGQTVLVSADNHIRMVSARTDGNVSLDRDTLVMTNADLGLDFYVYSNTDSIGKFSVSSEGSGWFANQLATEGKITISHREVTDDPQALIINSGAAATTTPTDIIWSRNSKESARLRFNDKFDMYLSVLNNSNVITDRIGLGSQRGTGLKHGVTLYSGDTSIKSLHTIENGIVIPTIGYDDSGIVLSSKTTTGISGTSSGNSSGSIFFKEDSAGKYGLSIEYFGSNTLVNGLGNNKMYINRFNNNTEPTPVLHFNRTDSNITNYGGIYAALEDQTGGDAVHKEWFKTYGWKHNSGNEGKILIQMDGALILGAGDRAGHEVATNIATPERLYMVSDFGMQFYTNLQNGWGNKKSMSFENDGKLTVEGEVFATNFQFTSDISLKENIKPLRTSLDIDFIEFNFKDSDTQRYGVSAQEVQKILPELVAEDNNGNLTVAMMDLMVLKIAELERKVKELIN